MVNNKAFYHDRYLSLIKTDNDKYYFNFYTNVLNYLRDKGLSKAEFANLSNVSPSYFSDITRGTANPTLSVMVQIADALNVPLVTLFTSQTMPLK